MWVKKIPMGISPKFLSFLTKGDDGSDYEMFTINFEVDEESIDPLYQGLKEDGTVLRI